MTVLFLVLHLLAGVFFGLAAGRVHHKYDFLALGLLCWSLVLIIQSAQKL